MGISTKAIPERLLIKLCLLSMSEISTIYAQRGSNLVGVAASGTCENQLSVQGDRVL